MNTRGWGNQSWTCLATPRSQMTCRHRLGVCHPSHRRPSDRLMSLWRPWQTTVMALLNVAATGSTTVMAVDIPTMLVHQRLGGLWMTRRCGRPLTTM